MDSAEASITAYGGNEGESPFMNERVRYPTMRGSCKSSDNSHRHPNTSGPDLRAESARRLRHLAQQRQALTRPRS
jgi:hypothetical protein